MAGLAAPVKFALALKRTHNAREENIGTGENEIHFRVRLLGVDHAGLSFLLTPFRGYASDDFDYVFIAFNGRFENVASATALMSPRSPIKIIARCFLPVSRARSTR